MYYFYLLLFMISVHYREHLKNKDCTLIRPYILCHSAKCHLRYLSIVTSIMCDILSGKNTITVVK